MTDVIGPPVVVWVEKVCATGCGRFGSGEGTDGVGCGSGMGLLPVVGNIVVVLVVVVAAAGGGGGGGVGVVGVDAVRFSGVFRLFSGVLRPKMVMVVSPEVRQAFRKSSPAATACGHRRGRLWQP